MPFNKPSSAGTPESFQNLNQIAVIDQRKSMQRSEREGSPSEIELYVKQLPKVRDFGFLEKPETRVSWRNFEGKESEVLAVVLTGAADVLSLDMPPQRAMNLADSLLEEVGFYPVNDVLLFLRRYVRGEFGPTYGKLSLDQMMTAWRRYDQERLDFIRASHERKKEMLNGSTHVSGLGTFNAPQQRHDNDNRERPIRSVEWVIENLYKPKP
jgi:hypothetical protein